jgi:hypothetical protein
VHSHALSYSLRTLQHSLIYASAHSAGHTKAALADTTHELEAEGSQT